MPTTTRRRLACVIAAGALLLACRNSTDPDALRLGDRCPESVYSLSGFVGCVEVGGVILDSAGRPASFPELEFVATSLGTFPRLDSMVVAPDGRFRARFVVGPLPGFEESDGVTLDGWLRYRIPDLLSSYHPSGVVDSAAARLEFVKYGRTPRRYVMTLRMGQ